MKEEKRNGVNFQLVMLLILAILLVIFTLQNSESVSLKLFFWPVKVPLVLLILASMLLGYLLPHFSYLPRIWSLKRELSRARKRVEERNSNTENRWQDDDPEGMTFDDLDRDRNE